MRAYDAYCRRTEDDRATGVPFKLYRICELLPYSQDDAMSLFDFGGREFTDEILAEGARKIARVADADAVLDLRLLEPYITRKLKLSPDGRLCDQSFAVPLNVQEFLHDRKLPSGFVLDGRCAKGPGAIVLRSIFAGLTPPGLCDDVRRRAQFRDAGSNPYRVVQLMEEML